MGVSREIRDGKVGLGIDDWGLQSDWFLMGQTTATTKYFYMYVYIAVVVVCCGEVGMRGETAWGRAARLVRDF